MSLVTRISNFQHGKLLFYQKVESVKFQNETLDVV